MSSFLLIGPTTKDLIIEKNTEHSSVGGAVYYQSFIFNSFNQDYSILTSLGKCDKDFINDFPVKSKIKCILRSESLFFKNNYYDDNPNHRKQSSNFINNPILDKDFKNINLNSYDCIILNPLVSTDIPLDTIEFLKNFNIPIALAIQGFLRCDLNGEVILKEFNDLEKLLNYIDMVFLDINEAGIIFKNNLGLYDVMEKIASYGPNEVIVTCGNNGSLIYSKKLNKHFKIPAYIPPIIKNPTGAGDTYMASYLIKRFSGCDIEFSGKFAAMTSSIKISNLNNFDKKQEYVLNNMKLNKLL
ncbi:PfkB family carbohydrate kinase [Methanobrevibacter sp. DSM 116169]|uniref:PfkB family carbohydrate kinase n=1 Tax=Methanobrevibacter sp. DSM 116169 TaxID=3242727 RepID=UPI0038FBF233